MVPAGSGPRVAPLGAAAHPPQPQKLPCCTLVMSWEPSLHGLASSLVGAVQVRLLPARPHCRSLRVPILPAQLKAQPRQGASASLPAVGGGSGPRCCMSPPAAARGASQDWLGQL